MATCDLQWNLNVVSGFIDPAMRFWPAAVCLVLATCDLQWILFAASGSTVPVRRLWNARSWVRLSFPSFFCFVAFAACSQHPVFYNGFWPAVIRQVTAHWKIQWTLSFGAESPQYMQPLCRDTIWQVMIYCKTQWFLNVEAKSLQYTVWSWLPACRVASSKWEKTGCWQFVGRCWFCKCASQDPLKNTMDYGLRVRIHCFLQVAVTASRGPAKHNGFWRGGQNPMCFSMDRELALFPHRFWSSSQLFVFF